MNTLCGQKAKSRKATICVCNVSLSVNIEQLGSHWAGFHEIWYLKVLRKSFQKVQGSLKTDKKDGTSREDRYTFILISRSVLLRMRNISGKCYRENQNTHFMFNNPPSPKIVPFMK
jgi:hypothetical protein